ncbi:RES family NAD+ phosphorylase [Clostridium swellfunianum]|uniref:RES family NAD+ phosphorylase n=1 Tax=Clostridium swellfunianum TaxID=1367462 RepID=UPI00202EEBE8|nr:RES family NAD+ phosphorylase [Clostridium swellfunianum]MCM0650035.1 RES family NAD+ phosphorylase [Clostridium swellfunianum]
MWISYIPCPQECIEIKVDCAEEVYRHWEDLENKLKSSRYLINTSNPIFQILDKVTDINISETTLYRARINEKIRNGGEGKFNKNELKAPPSELCKSGRLNPAGVSYLYLSDSKETCVSEVRPWIGSEVEVAEFYPVSNLLIKDLTINDKDDQGIRNLKLVLGENFSKPISSNNIETEYRITQCLAEYIRDYCKNSNGQSYDGIKFSSSAFQGGYNIVIFEPSKMRIGSIIGRAKIENVIIEF